MGNAKIWWYPEQGETVEEIDLGLGLSSLEEQEVPDQIVSESARGAVFALQIGSRVVVRATLERFTDAAVARQLLTLAGHLKRGGSIALAEDADKAVAGFLAREPERGATSVILGDQPWPLESGASLASGDEVWLEGPQPTGRRELAVLSGNPSGTSHPIGAGITYDWWVEDWVLLRHRGFYPVLRLPASSRRAELISTDRRLNYTMILPLEIPPTAYEAFAALGSEDVLTTQAYDGGRTIDDVMRDHAVDAGGPAISDKTTFRGTVF